RPPNAWIIFRSDMNRLLRIEDPKATQSALSKRISDLWATATPEVRAQYERRAEAAKVAHHARYPNYKFAP
ncbi:high mobility group box, partial [Gymnopus androsaceus JB14]